MRHSFLATVFIIIGALQGCTTPSNAVPDNPQHWQELARADILAAREALSAAHPGAIDPQNPGFRDWLDGGVAPALALVPRVRSYDDMLAAVRSYTVGFHDGHLAYSDNERPSGRVTIDGWHVTSTGGSIVVDRVAPRWPVELPPLGAELLGCDGRDAKHLVEEVAPYVYAPLGASGETFRLDALTLSPFSDQRWHLCRFRAADGRVLDLSQAWVAVEWETCVQLVSPRVAQLPHINAVARLADGTLWIRAGNFQPSPQENAELERMLAALASDPPARRIVFDTRANNGGDSGIGQRIFDAATGGLDVDPAQMDGLPLTQRCAPPGLCGRRWRRHGRAARRGCSSRAAAGHA